MMDTVLNIGMNDETAKGMVALTGNDRFVTTFIAALSRCSAVWSWVSMTKHLKKSWTK